MFPRTPQNAHLTLHTEGKRRFITIASDKAKKLRAYLQDKGIHTRQPESMTPGVDTIELLPGQKCVILWPQHVGSDRMPDCFQRAQMKRRGKEQ